MTEQTVTSIKNKPNLSEMYPLELRYASTLAGADREERNRVVVECLRQGTFDFLDFGTHKGGGLLVGKRLGGRTGFGIEINDEKVVDLFQRGAFAYSGNILDLPDVRCLKFAVCSHILEHLPSRYEIGAVINKLRKLCTSFIFIRQPSFEMETLLFERGLKMAHTTMKHHDCRITMRQFVDMLWDLKLERFLIGGAAPIVDSHDPWIHSAAGPKQVWQWRQGTDVERPLISFPRPIYRDLVLVIGLDDAVDLRRIAEIGGMNLAFMESQHMEFAADLEWPR